MTGDFLKVNFFKIVTYCPNIELKGRKINNAGDNKYLSQCNNELKNIKVILLLYPVLLW